MKEISRGLYQEDTESNNFIVTLNKEYYEKEPVMQAIHEYSNDFTIVMEPKSEKEISVFFTQKEDSQSENHLNLIKNFSNKVIDFQIRRDLEKEYGHIRDIIVNYAYSPVKKKLM